MPAMVAVPDKQDQQDPDRAEAAAADRAKKEIAIIRAHKEVAELQQQQRDERKRAERSAYRRGVTAESPAAARRNLQEFDLSSIARPPSNAGNVSSNVGSATGRIADRPIGHREPDRAA